MVSATPIPSPCLLLNLMARGTMDQHRPSLMSLRNVDV